MLLIYLALLGWATGASVDIDSTLNRQRERWKNIDDMFLMADNTVRGNLKYDVGAVLRVLDEPKGQRTIEQFGANARISLRLDCHRELVRRFMGEWSAIRDQLETEAIARRQPNPKCLESIRRWKDYARTYVGNRDDQYYDAHMVSRIASLKNDILRLLRPFVEHPYQAGSYDVANEQVGDIVVDALRIAKFVGSPVFKMLEEVEETLMHKTQVELPLWLQLKISTVNGIIRTIKQNGAHAVHSHLFHN